MKIPKKVPRDSEAAKKLTLERFQDFYDILVDLDDFDLDGGKKELAGHLAYIMNNCVSWSVRPEGSLKWAKLHHEFTHETEMGATEKQLSPERLEELQAALNEHLNEDEEEENTVATPKSKVKDVTIVHQGTEIILPVVNGKPMSEKDAIIWLERKAKENEQKFAVHYELPCAPLDGAVAFQKAIARIYGWSHGVPTPGFFGDRPPVMIGVPISDTEKTNVPWGRIEVPGIDGFLTTNMKADPYPSFVIGGEVKKKHAENVKQLVDLTREILRSESIYKGKAVKVTLGYDPEHFDPIAHAPQFMPLNGVSEQDLIFGEKVIASLNIGLFTPIEQSEACRSYKIPLKRGVLLHGPYGTGKTMTAYVSAVKAVRNGWTFIYLDDVRDLRSALQFAAQYAPAVLFAEDIDRAVTGERSTDMDAILNTLDGVDTKGAEIITVLTTNHLENINPAMLRPGRLDTLVEVTPPDAQAASRLVALYARGLLDEKADLNKIGEELKGNIPAFIREVTERAKIAAISRMNGKSIEGHVLEEDLLNAAFAMKNHASLLNPPEKKETKAPKLYVVQESEPGVSKATQVLEAQAVKF